MKRLLIPALSFVLFAVALPSCESQGSGPDPVETPDPNTDADGDGFAPADRDCDDADPAISPAAAEACDDVDNDCDAEIDEGFSALTWYPDADADGFGDSGGVKLSDCAAPAGYVQNGKDCDDTKASVNPESPECNNGIDDDCDALIDENDSYGCP